MVCDSKQLYNFLKEITMTVATKIFWVQKNKGSHIMACSRFKTKDKIFLQNIIQGNDEE